MTKRDKLVWRLKTLPTPDELRELVKDKLITNEEARAILFETTSVEERDENSLKQEIKFLRELVEKLSEHKQDRIVHVIKEVETRYIRQPWIQPYQYYCGVGGISASGLSSAVLCSATSNGAGATGATNFTNVKTF